MDASKLTTGGTSSSSNGRSLPPELLADIFGAVPLRPTHERHSTLATLCLVNHQFRDVARPILYSSVHLQLAKGVDRHSLYRTLVTNSECARLVKSLRVTADRPANEEWILFNLILEKCSRLEELKFGGSGVPETTTRVLGAVLAHKRSIKRLVLPDSIIDERQFGSVFPGLTDLEVFKGKIWIDDMRAQAQGGQEMVAAALARPTQFQLQELYLGWGPRQDAFDYMTRSSFTSLAHLTLTMNDWRATMDLSKLVSLTSLVLVANSHGPGFLSPSPLCLPAFTKAVESIKHLPLLRSLSLCGSLNFGQYPHYHEIILESFPSSLEELTLGPSAASMFDWRLLFHLLTIKRSRLALVNVYESAIPSDEPVEYLSHEEKCRDWLMYQGGTSYSEYDEEDAVDSLERLGLKVSFQSRRTGNNYLGDEIDPLGSGSEVESVVDDEAEEEEEEEEEEYEESYESGSSTGTNRLDDYRDFRPRHVYTL